MISVLTFLLGIAVTKGILEPFLAKWTKKGIIEYVPIVLDKLDYVMPEWIAMLTKEELREKVTNLIYETTKPYENIDSKRCEAILKEVILNYNFLVNADKYKLD